VAQVAVLGLVGTGYAVRIGLGVGLAGADGGVVVAAVAFGWVFGDMVVAMTWLFEAAGLRWGGATGVLARKSHIAVLALLVDDRTRATGRALTAGRPARLAAAWSAATAALAIVLGAGFDGAPGPLGAALLVVVAVVAGPLLLATWSSPWAGGVVTAAGGAAAALGAGGDKLGTVTLLVAMGLVATAFRSFTPAFVGLDPPGGTADR
jgi:hypothetical protein